MLDPTSNVKIWYNTPDWWHDCQPGDLIEMVGPYWACDAKCWGSDALCSVVPGIFETSSNCNTILLEPPICLLVISKKLFPKPSSEHSGNVLCLWGEQFIRIVPTIQPATFKLIQR